MAVGHLSLEILLLSGWIFWNIVLHFRPGVLIPKLEMGKVKQTKQRLIQAG